jgi:hypothetical protein
MADKGKVEQVEKATERMNNQLIAMANLAVPGGREDTQLEMATFEAAPAPAPVPTPAPAPAPEPETPQMPMQAPAPVIEVPPETEEEAPMLAAPRAAGPPEEAGKAGDRGQGNKIKPDSQARIREIVSEQALKNSQKLREVLERVPESLKPALRRALEVADNGYEQALRNLD